MTRRKKEIQVARAGTRQSYQNVLMEQIRSEVRAVYERVEIVDQKNEVRFDEMNQKVEGLRSDLQLTQKVLGSRIDRLENKVDKINDQLKQHFQEITLLKEACA